MLAQETQLRGVGIVLATFGAVLCTVYLAAVPYALRNANHLGWVIWAAASSLTATMAYVGLALYRLKKQRRSIASVVLLLTAVALPKVAPASLLGMYVLNRRKSRLILSQGYDVRVDLRDLKYHLRTWLYAASGFLLVFGLSYVHARLFGIADAPSPWPMR